MKSLLALATITLLGLWLAACGGSSGDASRTAKTSSAAVDVSTDGPRPKDSNDGDRDAEGDDDYVFLHYGQAASASETRAITAAIKRYYTDIATDNNADVCSMLMATLLETVTDQYSQAPGLHGRTCAAVLTKFFRPYRRQIAAELPSLRVTVARVGEEEMGLVVLRFATVHEPRKIALRRESGAWKVRVLLDSAMP